MPCEPETAGRGLRRDGDDGHVRIVLVAPSATAFPHRAEQYDFLIGSQWSDAAGSDRNVRWTRALFEAMEPHLEESVYVNNLGDEGPGRVRAAYGENHARLVSVKRTYDPDNLFRANQNIDPSTDISRRER
jgi:hypothetical protein